MSRHRPYANPGPPYCATWPLMRSIHQSHPFPASAPTQADVEAIVERASKRILRFLKRRGVITLVTVPGDGEVTVVTDETMGEATSVGRTPCKWICLFRICRSTRG